MNQLFAAALVSLSILTSCKKESVAGNGNGNGTGDIHYTPNTKTLDVDKNTKHVNVMGNQIPAIPSFTKLQVKPGRVRGHVKDWAGKPLAGATIGIRTSYFAGHYSSVHTKTDANGYYELAPAQGSSHFYNAGYQLQYGSAVAAVSLHPADGKLDSWTTADGLVEDFVLLPYGITSNENLQNNPQLPSSFYGGAIFLGWYGVEADDNNAPDFTIKEGTVIEITLTPEDKTLYGIAGQSFVIKKIAGSYVELRIQNIPLGFYKIDMKANGKALKIKNNRNYVQPFGLKPAEVIGNGSLGLMPENADPAMMAPILGAWEWVSLNLETVP
jgi:hypothetical protein